MASQWGPETFQFTDGSPMSNRPITVLHRNSLQLAQLYANAAESASASNPALTDGAGVLTLYLAAGYYDLMYEGNRFPITVGEGFGSGAVQELVHEQVTPAGSWNVVHNFGKIPHVVVTNEAGEWLLADMEFPSANQVVVTFATPSAGKAYLIAKGS